MINMMRVGIPLTGLMPPPHVCAFPKPGPGFPTSYVVGPLFVFSEIGSEVIVHFC